MAELELRILIMDSAESGDSSQTDLTAQARIRNAAIAHFARDGFQKANLRAIAAAAGVSEALIFHHFGSKDGLRATCDEHVLNVLIERARTAGGPSGLVDLLSVYLSDPAGHTGCKYVRRLDGGGIRSDLPKRRR